MDSLSKALWFRAGLVLHNTIEYAIHRSPPKLVDRIRPTFFYNFPEFPYYNAIALSCEM